MKIGMIFPGQGSQYLGMGKEFFDKERIVQEFFEEACVCLDKNFIKLCFASSDRELVETTNAQTSIFLVSAAISTLLNKKYGIKPSLVAGHSLGEYSAIFTAGGISFPDGLYLLKKRSQFMDEATKDSPGIMIAAIGISFERVKLICEQYDDPDDTIKVAQVVNFNTPKQVVISGTRRELENIKEDIETFGGKGIILNVAGAFHSRLMKGAEKRFAPYLTKVDFKELQVPVINNVAAEEITTPEQAQESLVKQTSSPILWWQAMQHFQDCDVIIEVGPNDKMGRMLKREWPDKCIISVNSQKDIEQLLQHIESHPHEPDKAPTAS